jgi:hypothetical protein
LEVKLQTASCKRHTTYIQQRSRVIKKGEILCTTCMTSNSFIFTWQNLHYYSSPSALYSALLKLLCCSALALLKVLQADGASTVQRSGHSPQARASRATPPPRARRALARVLEQTGAALAGNFLQNSCVAPNRCRFASNSKKNKPKSVIISKKPSAKKN